MASERLKRGGYVEANSRSGKPLQLRPDEYVVPRSAVMKLGLAFLKKHVVRKGQDDGDQS